MRFKEYLFILLFSLWMLSVLMNTSCVRRDKDRESGMCRDGRVPTSQFSCDDNDDASWLYMAK